MAKNYSSFFIRHGKLLLPYKNHNEMPFEVLADLGSFKLDPSIDNEFTAAQMPQLANNVPFGNIEKIYASPSKRCQDTAQFIEKFILGNYKNKVDVVTSLGLGEIKFDLAKIYPHKDRENFDIESINDVVFGAMINSSENCESADSAYKRIDYFLRSIGTNGSNLFITHDFIMRVIEIYIRNKGEASHVVTYEELKSTQRNLYLHGFVTDFTLSDFLSF